MRSLREVDPAEWAPLAAGRGLVVSHAYLSSLESMEATGTYLLARDAGGRLVGAMPVYLWDGGGHLLRNYDPHLLLTPERIRDPADHQAWFPFALLGTRSSYRNELLVHPERRGDQELLSELLAAGLGLARELGAVASGLLYLSVEAARALVPVLPPEMAVLLTSADTRLVVRWPDFDGYIASLRAGRRQSALRELAAFEAAGFEVVTCRLGACVEEGAPLFAALLRRYGIEMTEEAARAHLRAQADAMDPHSVVWVCRREGRMVAFSACYEWEGDLYSRLAGFDYAETEGSAAYFNLGYYLPIRHAVMRDLRSVWWGPAAFDAKLHRGAHLDPLWSAVIPPEAISRRWRRHTAGWNTGILRWFRGEYGKHGRELPDGDWTRAGLVGSTDALSIGTVPTREAAGGD